MGKNMEKLWEFVREQNSNLMVEDMEAVLAKELGKPANPEVLDKRFAIIRKNKQYSMAINLAKLQEIGFNVENLTVFNGKDELMVTVKEEN